MRKIHYTDNYLLKPYHPVTVFIIGAGGTGSQVITNLARMDTALQASGHPGLHVTLFDPDRFFGTAWMAESRRYPPAGTSKNRDDKPELANIIITCTDNVRSRLDLWRFLKKYREITINNEKTVYYWMDFGNTQTTGQVFIGTVRNKIKQPVSKEFLPVPRMNVITEEVSYSVIKEKDSGPSCSLVEALGKQDLYINSMLAQVGCGILWRMFKEGRTLYRGAYVNLDTLRVNPVPV